MVALADSFLGQGRYDDAERLLLCVMESPSTASNISRRAALRLLKINRRQRKPPDWVLLTKAVNEFYKVSAPLKFHCLEETTCFLSLLDRESVTQAPQAFKVISALS